jgi:ferredoxin
MYVILTTKPGVFRTELTDGLTPVEAYDYILFGKRKAQFVIARIEGSPRIRIVEDEPPHVVNLVPSKFLQKFESIGAAHQELLHLAKFSSTDVRLEKIEQAAVGQAASGLARVTFITNEGKVAVAPVNSNLLRVSLREQGGIPFKCGGGLCGTCKCRIEAGLENTDEIKAKERKHLSAEDFKNGYRMACQTFVKGDVSVSWQPKSHPSQAVPAVASPAPCAS